MGRRIGPGKRHSLTTDAFRGSVLLGLLSLILACASAPARAAPPDAPAKQAQQPKDRLLLQAQEMIYDRNKNTTSLDLAAGMGWQLTRVIGLEARFVHAPYKAFDLNNPTSTTRTEVNRDGNFLQLAGTFRW